MQEGPLGTQGAPIQGWVDPVPMLTPETIPQQTAHQAFWGKVMEAERIIAQHRAETPQTLPQLRKHIVKSIRAFEQVSGLTITGLGLVRHKVSETAEILQVTTTEEVRT